MTPTSYASQSARQRQADVSVSRRIDAVKRELDEQRERMRQDLARLMRPARKLEHARRTAWAKRHWLWPLGPIALAVAVRWSPPLHRLALPAIRGLALWRGYRALLARM